MFVEADVAGLVHFAEGLGVDGAAGAAWASGKHMFGHLRDLARKVRDGSIEARLESWLLERRKAVYDGGPEPEAHELWEHATELRREYLGLAGRETLLDVCSRVWQKHMVVGLATKVAEDFVRPTKEAVEEHLESRLSDNREQARSGYQLLREIGKTLGDYPQSKKIETEEPAPEYSGEVDVVYTGGFLHKVADLQESLDLQNAASADKPEPSRPTINVSPSLRQLVRQAYRIGREGLEASGDVDWANNRHSRLMSLAEQIETEIINATSQHERNRTDYVGVTLDSGGKKLESEVERWLLDEMKNVYYGGPEPTWGDLRTICSFKAHEAGFDLGTGDTQKMVTYICGELWQKHMAPNEARDRWAKAQEQAKQLFTKHSMPPAGSDGKFRVVRIADPRPSYGLDRLKSMFQRWRAVGNKDVADWGERFEAAANYPDDTPEVTPNRTFRGGKWLSFEDWRAITNGPHDHD